MADHRRPLHLAVMIGASPAVYAASLAASPHSSADDERASMSGRRRPKRRPPDSARARIGPGWLGLAADACDGSGRGTTHWDPGC